MDFPNPIRTLYIEALGQPATRRSAWVEGRSDVPPVIRAEVLSLLRYESTGGFTLDPSRWFGFEEIQPESIGPYRVQETLGRGGMGIVYRAVDPESGEDVAVKVLRGAIDSPPARARFERESALLCRLDHPGIARFRDSGEFAFSRSVPNRPYLVMDLVRGMSLREWMEQGNGRRAERLAVLAAVCDAVQHAHERGVLHRDLKPENIRLTADGRPRILDFGVARTMGSGAPQLTVLTDAGRLVGTLGYMSPEQLGADPGRLDGRSDVYSLGVIAYELLCGRPPHVAEGNSVHGMLVAILTGTPPQPRTLVPDMDPGLEAILEHAIAREPENRYESAGDLAADLRRFAGGDEPLALRLLRSRKRASHRARLRRRLVVAAVLLLGLGTGGHLVRSGLKARTPSPGDLLARILPAQNMLHLGEGTVEGTLRALDILQGVESDLARVESDSLASQIRILVCWRLGEASYFLGSDLDDPSRFTQAVEYFDRAFLIPRLPEVRRRLDPDAPVAGDIARFPVHRGLTGMGLAFSELATMGSPLRNHSEALAVRQRALSVHQGRFGPNYTLPDSSVAWVTDLGMIRNELGSSLSELARITGDASYLERARAEFASADTLTRFVGWGPPYASFLHNYGTALRRLAVAQRTPALLDSAEDRLVAALEFRTPATSPAAYARTQIERVRVMRARVDFDDDVIGVRATLDGILKFIESVRGVLEDGLPGREARTLTREESLVRLSLARLDRDSEAARNAVRALEGALADLRGSRRLVDLVEAELELAVASRILWELSGAEEDRVRAATALDRAAVLVPGAQYPALHRQIQDERGRIGG